MLRALFVILAVVAWLRVPGSAAALAPPAQADADAVAEAVRRANSDEVYGEAYRSLNGELLRSAWGGEALLDMLDDLDGLRAQQQYLDLTLEQLDIVRQDPLGPTRVRVVTLERWLARLYQTSGTYVGFQRQTVENRYLVDRRDDGWYIIEVDQSVQGSEAQPPPSGP
jgi:hypothetical protein